MINFKTLFFFLQFIFLYIDTNKKIYKMRQYLHEAYEQIQLHPGTEALKRVK